MTRFMPRDLGKQRVYIDFSLFTPGSAVGVIHGLFEVEVVPKKGDFVAFEKAKSAIAPPDVSAFTPRILVEEVLPPVEGTTDNLLCLADVTVASRAEALKLAEYFQDGFGLYFDDHELTN